MKKMKIYKKIAVLLAASSLSLQTIGCADNNEVTFEESIVQDADSKVLDKIDSWMNDTDNILNNDNIDKMNQKIEDVLVSATDFVIFGGSITLDDGTEITLEDCSDEVKEKVQSSYSIMVAKIEEKCPGMTTKVSEYFNTAKEFTKDTAISAKEYMGEKISEFIEKGYQSGYYDEGTYNFMKEFKEGIGPQLKEDFNNGKETINDIYNSGKEVWEKYMEEREKEKIK